MAERWWQANSALPRRTKLLILAVVARGLSRGALTERVESLLQEKYDLSAADFTAPVAHLRGDVLRRCEKALLPLARESTRYEAGAAQQTVREHVQGLYKDSRGNPVLVNDVTAEIDDGRIVDVYMHQGGRRMSVSEGGERPQPD